MPLFRAWPGSSAGKESTCNAGDAALIPGLRSSPEEIGYSPQYSWGSLVVRWERICLQFRRPGFNSWVDPLEEGMATHYSILAWRIPMDRGAWWLTVHEVAESKMTERISASTPEHKIFMFYF